MSKFKDFWKNSVNKKIQDVSGQCENCGYDYSGKLDVTSDAEVKCPKCGKMSENWDTTHGSNMSPGVKVKKGKEGIDFGLYFDSVKKVWCVSQIGTGRRLFESKDENEARTWGLRNASAGIFNPNR